MLVSGILRTLRKFPARRCGIGAFAHSGSGNRASTSGAIRASATRSGTGSAGSTHAGPAGAAVGGGADAGTWVCGLVVPGTGPGTGPWARADFATAGLVRCEGLGVDFARIGVAAAAFAFAGRGAGIGSGSGAIGASTGSSSTFARTGGFADPIIRLTRNTSRTSTTHPPTPA